MNILSHAKSLIVKICCFSALALAACSGGGGSTATAPDTTNLSVAYGNASNAVVTPLYSSLDPELLPGVDPAANHAATVVQTYSPAQIRVAYQMPALPTGLSYATTSTNGLTAAQLASLGAGQTIYIIGAFDDPHIATELDAFNRQFNLPPCIGVSIASTQSLPLAAASTADLCKFSKVYAGSSAPSGGTLSPTAPSYDSGWATEMALDVQWAHATAPLARIILIEAADSNQASITNAIALANSMGSGVVSMSFGAAEDTTTSSLDNLFGQTGMTYVAATGDTGTASGPMWPSVSPLVLAVGATTLSSYTASARTESAWSSTGGGTSQYVALPGYQNSSVLGFNLPKRSVADVSFNGDPYTGQYVYTIDSNNSGKWLSVGGTSLGTPQWAGIVSVLNAQKSLANQGRVGLLQSSIYPVATSGGGLWGANKPFSDVTSGSSGSIPAGVGYDIPTGLGTPNLTPLICLVSGSNSCSTPMPNPGSAAPVLSGQTINGTAGKALAFNVQYSAVTGDLLSWRLSSAPAVTGMTINSSGQVTWPSPVQGTYSVTVTATDSTNHTSGSAVFAVSIAAANTPTPIPVNLSGNAGVAFTYQFPTYVSSNGDLLSYNSQTSLTPTAGTVTTSVPAGLTLGNSGQLSWSNPVQGTYHLTVTANDTSTTPAISYPFNLTLTIGSALHGPTIQSTSYTGTTNRALSGSIAITDTDNNVTRINLSIMGAPSGMQFYVIQGGLAFTWPRPVAGTYTFTVKAVDATTGHNNLSTTATETITIH